MGSASPNEISERSIVGLLNQLLITAEVSSTETMLRARFDFEGTKFALDAALDDTNFIMLSAWWKLQDDVFGSEVLPRCNRFSNALRFAKFYWAAKDNSILISVEFIATGIVELGTVLKPYLGAINHAAKAVTA